MKACICGNQWNILGTNCTNGPPARVCRASGQSQRRSDVAKLTLHYQVTVSAWIAEGSVSRG